jgi:F-type H+-transporting ATPase subunit c
MTTLIEKHLSIALLDISNNLVQGSKFIGSGLATCGLIGAGVGVGIVFGSFLISLSKNPEEVQILFRYAIFGFALTEAVGLLALMMSFLILFI